MEENRKNDCDLIEWSTPMSSPHKPFRNTNGIPRDNRDNRGRFTSNKANGSINLILFEQTHHNENAVTIPASASLSTGDSGSYSTTQDEENCADGILEIEAPKILNDSDDDILEGRGEALDLDDEAVGLAEEDYYASLFARCKPDDEGRVKLSVLLSTLRDLQALALADPHQSTASDSSCGEELLELGKVIDPDNADPNISVATFTKGITTYVLNKKWSCLSPIKCSSIMGDDDGLNHSDYASWPRRQFGSISPGSRNAGIASLRNSRSLLDISHISYVPPINSDTCLEASNGVVENGDPDWRAEISDLQLQVQKLSEDNVVLKTRVNAAQDENFNLFQVQQDERDKKEMEMRSWQERIKRLERELLDKNMIISSLEDKSVVLGNRNARLENECVAYLKERKELVSENEELRVEVKNTLRLLTSRDELVSRLKNNTGSAEKQWEAKEKWLNERNEALSQDLDQMTAKIERLEAEKANLESKVRAGKSEDAAKKTIPLHYTRQGTVLTLGPHSESFDLDVSTDDIETELLAAQGNLPAIHIHPVPAERFDVATQCETDQIMQELLETLQAEVHEICEIFNSLRQQTHSSSSPDKGEGTAEVRSAEMRNGSGSTEHKSGSNKRQKQSHHSNDGITPTHLSESCATEVVRQINEELAEFREQLKKSQELFTVLRYNSCQSVSLTKSCPGLVLPPNDSTTSIRYLSSTGTGTNGSSGMPGKAVSCGTQTDSPVIETPVLAQKLSLVSSSPGSGGDHGDPFHHHHHQQNRPPQQIQLLCQDGDFRHFMSNDSMDNASFDKLSDDGSVRVRDDLSMVLEVSEQETETSPGAARRSMSADKGSLNRPRLQRMPNTREDEEPHHCSSQRKGSKGAGADVTSSASGSSGGGGGCGSDRNHHLGVDDVLGVVSDNDYVSATSSQAESVYLSLERPLKVTVSSSKDGDRSSGGFRSCASSLRSGRSGSVHAVSPAADCDTASVISEGNTTFGSPLSSPSSPYWTPSQGSSSQETITPVDGDRTPVNEQVENEGHLNCENYSPSDLSDTLKFPPADHSDRKMGRIRDSEMLEMYRRTYDAVARATDKGARCLSTKEWQQLRHDKDHSDKEVYRKTFAQEEGNEDDGAVGVDGVSGVCASNYAFVLDEEAEGYLELLPKLAERLFQALDSLKEKKEAPTSQDLDELERKFNHMAEVFQTEHTNLDQRMGALSKDLKESQANLKDISHSLKSSVSTLKEISNSNVVMPAADNLLDVMKTLGSTSDEFELYSSAMYRNARRMGMMDVQNRLHKMLDVMILYVHIIRSKYDNLKSDFENLQTDFVRARELLDENNIAFTPNHSLGSLQNNNNIEEKQGVWDVGEPESSFGDRCDDGESEPEKILRHLLGPKKSSAGLSRNKDIITLKAKRTNENIVVRYLSEGYEVLRRELFWPWNLEQTMKGLKQGFSVMLMILGLFVFLRGFLPSVSAIDDGCITNPSYFKGVGAYFSSCGHLSHDNAPVI